MNRRIGIGRTAEVFEYGTGQVLKLFYAGFPDSFIETELCVAMILNRAPALAPHCDGAVDQDGRRGIVYALVPGVQLAACIVAKPLELLAHTRRLIGVQLAIFQAESLPLPPVKQRLAWGLEHAKYLKSGERRSFELQLERLPEGEAILHGDFHPQNLLVDGEAHAVIDWTNATLGNPLADVARSWVILRFGRAPAGSLSPLMLTISRIYMRLMAVVYEGMMRKSLGYRKADFLPWTLVVAAARLAELGDDAEMRETRSWLCRRLGSLKAG